MNTIQQVAREAARAMKTYDGLDQVADAVAVAVLNHFWQYAPYFTNTPTGLACEDWQKPGCHDTDKGWCHHFVLIPESNTCDCGIATLEPAAPVCSSARPDSQTVELAKAAIVDRMEAYGAPGMARLLDALILAVRQEQEIADCAHVIAHWFTQGGKATFGDIEGGNADELIAAILRVTRAKLSEQADAGPAPITLGCEQDGSEHRFNLIDETCDCGIVPRADARLVWRLNERRFHDWLVVWHI